LALRREIETTATAIIDEPFMEAGRLFDGVSVFARKDLPEKNAERAESLCRLYAIGALGGIELLINHGIRHKRFDLQMLHVIHCLNAASLEFAGDSDEISARLFAPKFQRSEEARRAALARHSKRSQPAKGAAREHFREHRTRFANDDKWIDQFRTDSPRIDISYKTLLNWCTDFRKERDPPAR